MEPFRYHVFLCEQQKPEGLPCCAARGSRAVADALRREIAVQGLMDEVQVTSCGSLGLCERGPNLVVYPEGIWYSGVRPEDVPEIVRSHFREHTPVARLVNADAAALKTEIRGNRDRYLAGLRARDASGMLPDDLAQVIRGFQESRVMLTAIELDLFTAVGEGATAAEAAATMGTDGRATEMLLNALAAMGMLVKREGVFSNSPATARYFIEGSPDNSRMAQMHGVHLWSTWSTLTDCVRTGTSAPGGGPAGRDLWTRAFIAAMHHNAKERAPLAVKAIGTANVARVLDVGGGSGAYAIAFAQAEPRLRVDLLDRPEVLPIAGEHIAAAGLGDRIATRPGDLRSDSFGSGYDLVLLSAICHMLDPDENRDLLRRCREALRPGGRIAIQDFILSEDKTAPKFAALFSLNMLVGTSGGASYSEAEYARWLGECGFEDIRHVRLPGPSGIMLAVRR